MILIFQARIPGLVFYLGPENHTAEKVETVAADQQGTCSLQFAK